jgi:hypothetical protein
MNLMALAVALLQSSTWSVAPAAPTVGDTVVLERVLPTAAGAMGRTRALEADDLLQPLGRPEVEPHVDGLLVRHRLALFAPGQHPVVMPAIEVLHPDGTVEVIVGDTAYVGVTAVIPDTADEPAPMPSKAPLARGMQRPVRLALPIGLVLLVLGAWVLWRRRAPRPPAAVEPPSPEVPDLPLMRWLHAGERRAVATLAAHRVRDAVATAESDAPGATLTELTDVLRALERARFAPLGADDLVELVDRADVALARFAAESEVARTS